MSGSQWLGKTDSWEQSAGEMDDWSDAQGKSCTSLARKWQ